MLTSALSGIPFSYTMHGPAIFFEPMRWRIDEKIARARFVACISHFCRSQGMLFSDPAHWSKLRLVHCGVIPEQYDRATRDGSGRILFVGRLAAVKGVPLLFDALKRLLPDHPGASLTVIGDGPARAELEAMAAEPPLTGRVSFLGYRGQAEVAEELARSDMLVLPSFAEGVPVVLMEAMASRMPVIASQVAGIPELIRDGESGHVVPAGDVDTLADRMGRLLADPALRGRMGEAGRAMIEAEYDVRREAAWLLTLFKGEAGERLRPEGGMR
ncbi:MAG: glycosyltransferase [Paracoccaceae bacterium]